MEYFRVIKPSQQLLPYIRQYWLLRLEDVVKGRQRLIPFGCVVLTFYRTKPDNNLSFLSSLSGQATSYTNINYSGTIDFISIVFEPVGAMAFFNMPFSEINNHHISLNDLNDLQILELEEKLNTVSDGKECVEEIENFLLKRICNFDSRYYSRLSAVIQSINSGENNISNLAQTACFSYKQFKRVFSEQIGINPSNYLRIHRFQRASYLMQSQPEMTLTQVADEVTYSDKSHLIREFREFCGYTPTEYKQLASPYSEYHYLFRSAFLDSPLS